MKTFVLQLLADEKGAAGAEYALLLAVIGASIAAGAIFLGAEIGTALDEAATCIQTDGSTC